MEISWNFVSPKKWELWSSLHRAIATVTLDQIQQISCDKQIAVTIASCEQPRKGR